MSTTARLTITIRRADEQDCDDTLEELKEEFGDDYISSAINVGTSE